MPDFVGETHRRKIQLIAGITYSISLPKKWVKEHGLKEKSELLLNEKSDGSLIISPSGQITKKEIDTFDLDIDSYKEDASQILFVLYYLGSENINIFSKKSMPFELKSRIKEALRHMSGTEIIFEDAQRIKIKVLLDKSKVDINQIFYRTALLINSSIDIILTNFNTEEIKGNEYEIDRLYHLIAKIILLSHADTSILLSSNIKNIYYLTSYLLISKKLENIGDSINNLSLYLSKNQSKIKEIKKILLFFKESINSGINFFMNKEKKSFTKTDKEAIRNIGNEIEKLKDLNVIKHLDDILRFLVDVEEELTNISFYDKLISEGVL